MMFHLEHMLISEQLNSNYIDYGSLIELSREESTTFSFQRLRRLTSTLLSRDNELSEIQEVQLIMTKKATLN
jgi:hypothetical protein